MYIDDLKYKDYFFHSPYSWYSTYTQEHETVELKKGDKWYIKYPNATALVGIKIEELTEKTVVLSELSDYYGITTRYQTSDIIFVEKLEK